MPNILLGITLPKGTKKSILDKIIKYTYANNRFIHVVSINPENIVIAQSDKLFKRIVNKAQIKIVDGVGVVAAAKTLSLDYAERFPGVDLVEKLIQQSGVGRLRVMLIGGKDKLAEYLANCYNQSYPEAKYIGLKGIEDITNIKKSEEEEIFSIITDMKPHLILVSFGSPHQEKWIWKNKKRFKNIVCMGVGGSFDYLSGQIKRPPLLLRKIGLEWLYRLVIQPWRWRRQMRLIRFIWEVFKLKYRF